MSFGFAVRGRFGPFFCPSSSSGAGSGIRVREVDGSPDIDPTTILTVLNDSLSVGGAEEAILTFPPSGGFALREVVLSFTETLASGTTFNIQTGVYAGAGSPASVIGDTDVTLPATGAAFKDDGRIEIHLNGQDLDKGDGTGNGTAEWISSTQIKINLKIKNKGMVMVRAPFPTA